MLIGILFTDILLISVGLVLAIYTMIGNIQEPIRNMAMLFSSMVKNKENIKLLEEYISKDETYDYVLKDFNYLDFKIDNIQFDDKVILNNLEFKFNYKDFLIIKGESGKGKSTIL